MENTIIILDAVGFLAFGVAIAQTLRLQKPQFDQPSRLFLLFGLAVYLLVMFSNILEHSGIAPSLDDIEDYLEILFFPFFLFFLFAHRNWREMARRTAAELELRQTEQRFRQLMENAGDSFFVSNREGRFIDANRQALQATGFNRAELLAMHVSDLDLDHSREDVASVWQTLQQHSHLTVRGTHRRKDNSTYPAEVRVTLMDYPEGQVLFSIARDISERLAREKQLRENEARLRLALEAAQQGMYDLDLVSGNAIVNDQYALMLGYDPAEFVETNQRWLERLHPDDAERVTHLFRSYLNGEIADYKVEFRQRTKQDEWKWILSQGRIVEWDQDGRPLRMLGTHLDLSERKQSEEKIRKERQQLYDLLNGLPGYVYLQAPDYTIRFANRLFREIFGDPAGRFCYQVMQNREAPCETCRTFRVFRDARPQYWEWEIGPDNRTYQVFDFPFTDADGTPLVLEFGLDITERKKGEEEKLLLERQLLHVQKLESLGVMAGGIAHDFNNLLMAILGNANLALRDLPKEAPFREHLQAIETASQRAADLCKQMLAYSGRGTFLIGPLDLSDLVREMIRILDVSIGKRAQLELKLTPRLPAIEGDAAQIRQIIMNIIMNASEAITNQGGTITVRTRVEDFAANALHDPFQHPLPGGRYVLLEVTDTGCGMDEKTRARLFDPFFSTKFTGRGLGMSAVLGIVRAHRGCISVQSAPGVGTTVRLAFPAAPPSAAAPAEDAQVTPDHHDRGGTILLMDDEEVVREIASMMIERLGYTVLAAADGVEGLALLDQHQGEIIGVVLDLTMPNMDGAETYRQIRERDATLPVILSSGYSEEDATRRFPANGLFGFIQKPYTMEQVTAVLQRLS